MNHECEIIRKIIAILRYGERSDSDTLEISGTFADEIAAELQECLETLKRIKVT